MVLEESNCRNLQIRITAVIEQPITMWEEIT